VDPVDRGLWTLFVFDNESPILMMSAFSVDCGPWTDLF
jgi:hypothetical protein